MKRTSKLNNNSKDYNLKLLAVLMAGSVLSVGIKTYADTIKDNQDDNKDIIDYSNELTIDSNKYTQDCEIVELEPASDEYYRSILIGDRVLNFANTPTPTPSPNYDLIDAYTDEMIIGEDGVYPDGYQEYLDRKNHTLKFNTVGEMVSFYSKAFELKEDVAQNIISDFLNGNDYSLDSECMINDNYYYSVEEYIARTLYDISAKPEDYGFTEEDILSDNGYELDYYLPEELIYKFSHVLDVNPNIALAIAYGESGRKLNSSLFINNNNVGGMVGSNGFAYYKNQATGLYRFVQLLHDRYYVTMDSDYSRIKTMAYGYCEVPDHWIGLVGSIYFELEENGYDYTYNTYNYQDRDLILCDEEEPSFYRSRYYNN